MKNLSIVFVLMASVSFGQVSTTVQNGDFWNPFSWDCNCIPSDGDSLVINHDITLSTGITYTMGQIKINSSGSLDDGTNAFSFYINGGSMINYGTLIIDNLLLDSGFIENHGTANMDSVWTRSTTTNTGTLTTNAFAHDQAATFTNTGTISVMNNYSNQGSFINDGIMTVGGNASNCNIQTLIANFKNDGFLCVTGNFLNCANDTLEGSGTVFIGGTSTNAGEVSGTLLINTSSGSFDLNTGNIAGTVTYGTDACAAGVEEEEMYVDEEDWILFPNPATTIINSSEINVKYFIYNMEGKLMLNGVSFNGVIHIDQLEEGNYVIRLENEIKQTFRKTFIKL
jgi:Secretion system C-terminal sorting domain